MQVPAKEWEAFIFDRWQVNDVTTGRAAELLGVPVAVFLALAEERGLNVLRGDPADLAAVLIPEAVAREVAMGIHLGKPGPDLTSYPWATLKACVDDPRITEHRLRQHLGAGERAALSLALTIDGSAVLIDERDARTVAHDPTPFP